ncbi:MAG: maleylpyruvate isomerase family mycothiol-dependent enzyme [Acidimicrobiales bacterium]|nr:maleylpyruvate isomerase family mycothiol-dependent enzyme [Acidimicrobiales bacterium]
MTLDDQYREAIRRAVAGLGALDPSDLSFQVPSCPEWDLEALVAHLATIHHWAAGLLRAGLNERFSRRDVGAPPPGAQVLGWLDAGSKLALAALEEDLDRPVRTWAGEQPARWWLRRLAHESSMHAWDGLSAVGRSFIVKPPLAVDAINETFDLFVPILFRHDLFAGHGETMHLHATDAAGEWHVTFDPGVARTERLHTKADVAVRGPAFELLLLLWGRRQIKELEVFGNEEILERFRAAAQF